MYMIKVKKRKLVEKREERNAARMGGGDGPRATSWPFGTATALLGAGDLLR